VKEIEKRNVNEKLLFLKTIPEFVNIGGISRFKLVNLCKNMVPFSLIKNQVLFKEGDPSKYVYFVKSGELKMCKKIILPQNDEEAEDVADDPNLLQKNQRLRIKNAIS
jgi:hypothetical protein